MFFFSFYVCYTQCSVWLDDQFIVLHAVYNLCTPRLVYKNLTVLIERLVTIGELSEVKEVRLWSNILNLFDDIECFLQSMF